MRCAAFAYAQMQAVAASPAGTAAENQPLPATEGPAYGEPWLLKQCLPPTRNAGEGPGGDGQAGRRTQLRAHGSKLKAHSTGSRTVKVLPFPGRLLTEIFPSWAWTIHALMARPK